MRKRSGFSLIELIIVIFLMLLVYSIVFTYYKKEGGGPQTLSPSNLKKVLLKTIPSNEHTTFLCTNMCDKCYLRVGEETTFSPYSGKTDLKNSTVYIMDQEEILSPVEYGKFKGDNVCLMIDFYPNGSSTQIVLKTPKETYFLPAYFGNTQKVGTLEDAQELWLKNTQLLSDSGDYY